MSGLCRICYGTFLCGLTALAGAVIVPSTLLADEPADKLRVRVAYSPRLRGVPSWSADLDCALSRAGAILEDAIGRGLTLESRVPWFGASVGRAPRDLRQALVADVERQGADLILGLAVHFRKPPPGPRPEGILTEPFLDFTVDEGLTHYTEGYLVLDVLGEEICSIYRLLAHEIAHVFGGVHRTGRRLLMDPVGEGVDIDPLNAEIFALHRDRGFGKGQAPLSGAELRTLWGLARADLEDAQTWIVVGALAARMGRHAAAVRLYEKALAIEPDLPQALVYLGHVRFQLGELRAAEATYLRALENLSDDDNDVGLVANNLAAVYYGLEEPEKALPYLEKALALGYAVNPGLIDEIEKLTSKR